MKGPAGHAGSGNSGEWLPRRDCPPQEGAAPGQRRRCGPGKGTGKNRPDKDAAFEKKFQPLSHRIPLKFTLAEKGKKRSVPHPLPLWHGQTQIIYMWSGWAVNTKPGPQDKTTCSRSFFLATKYDIVVYFLCRMLRKIGRAPRAPCCFCFSKHPGLKSMPTRYRPDHRSYPRIFPLSLNTPSEHPPTIPGEKSTPSALIPDKTNRQLRISSSKGTYKCKES